MNVNISTEVTETTVIENDNAKVVVTNGKITLIKQAESLVITRPQLRTIHRRS